MVQFEYTPKPEIYADSQLKCHQNQHERCRFFFYREYYLKLGNFHWLKELIASLLVWRKKMIKNQKQAYLFVVSNHVSTFCYWRTKMQLISQWNSGHLAVGTFQTVQNSIVFKKTSITSCNLQQWLLVRILQF